MNPTDFQVVAILVWCVVAIIIFFAFCTSVMQFEINNDPTWVVITFVLGLIWWSPIFYHVVKFVGAGLFHVWVAMF
jgi:hypothetical protein